MPAREVAHQRQQLVRAERLRRAHADHTARLRDGVAHVGGDLLVALQQQRAVLQHTQARADDFSGPLQDFLTEHVWGAVWTRRGLSPKQRSMLNLAILTAISRPEELALHLRGALNKGATREEIREIFLHCGA